MEEAARTIRIEFDDIEDANEVFDFFLRDEFIAAYIEEMGGTLSIRSPIGTLDKI